MKKKERSNPSIYLPFPIKHSNIKRKGPYPIRDIDIDNDVRAAVIGNIMKNMLYRTLLPLLTLKRRVSSRAWISSIAAGTTP